MKESFLYSKAFIPAYLWSLFILLISWNAGNLNLPPSLFDLVATDKLAHATVYGILFFLFWKGLQKSNRTDQKWLIRFAVWCGFYGVLMEVLQYLFFPGRYFEFFDILANFIGVLSVSAFFYFRKKRKAI